MQHSAKSPAMQHSVKSPAMQHSVKSLCNTPWRVCATLREESCCATLREESGYATLREESVQHSAKSPAVQHSAKSPAMQHSVKSPAAATLRVVLLQQHSVKSCCATLREESCYVTLWDGASGSLSHCWCTTDTQDEIRKNRETCRNTELIIKLTFSWHWCVRDL